MFLAFQLIFSLGGIGGSEKDRNFGLVLYELWFKWWGQP